MINKVVKIWKLTENYEHIELKATYLRNKPSLKQLAETMYGKGEPLKGELANNVVKLYEKGESFPTHRYITYKLTEVEVPEDSYRNYR